ncbi:uncharacterized protein SPPG_04456 [Spizellomyces punctatus DAOM BR117]|uniref:SDE2-like domain-containing protein n=1 Tax=Spizellomyces punctatus (strain DAOM BR117) TaxID=645134 RepID=A0A0L0HH58_SPIPD|nr:uncharacterized protein SPPG_04456 [Spizellomyces punctatus DAOM BR117]KND00114.1 hypothetical protein SPPG_04456 [Spizellomyces punctatus DAOM BR117]|eukprot:XP_016608153.1 hypothetical protein SPPG_04456 [Spizellomyces punctatus DAOM BR117]
MPSQVIINTFAGLKPLCLQFPDDSPSESPLLVEDLKFRLTSILNIPADVQRLTTEGGRSLDNNDILFPTENTSRDVFPPVFNLLLRLPGGKGGFGSMLRAQGGKMASQKTTNFEACRDLSGRRLKTVNDAKKLADYLEKEPERKRKRQEELMKKIEEGLKEPQKQKIRYHDPEFVSSHEKVMEDVKDAVTKALAAAPSKAAAPRKPSPPALAQPAADLSQWDALSDAEESEEEEEEEWEEEQAGEGSSAGGSSETTVPPLGKGKGKEVDVSA